MTFMRTLTQVFYIVCILVFLFGATLLIIHIISKEREALREGTIGDCVSLDHGRYSSDYGRITARGDGYLIVTVRLDREDSGHFSLTNQSFCEDIP